MKRIITLVAAAAVCFGLMVCSPGEASAAEKAETKVLTEAQKQEIADLQKKALEQEKQIIEKYVEYGVFTEAKAEQITKHMDQRFEKLEQDGFIPKLHRPNHHPPRPNE